MTAVALEVLVGVYILGVFRCWLRTGVNHGVRWREVIAFVGALLSLIVAFVSMLESLIGELFSAHMVQHYLDPRRRTAADLERLSQSPSVCPSAPNSTPDRCGYTHMGGCTVAHGCGISTA